MSRVAVITGAGRGIGRACALALAQAGYSVGLQARSRDQLDETARQIEGAGGRALVVPGDVTEAGAAQALVDGASAAFGRVDVAVAGAGQAISQPLGRTTEAQLRQMLDVNLIAAFHLMQAAVPAMDKDGGRLVVIASTAAVKGMSYTAAYSASKHAVLGLVRSAALELARKQITVNALCPGWVDTAMFDATLDNIVGKTGRSREEARAAIEARIPTRRVCNVDEVAATLKYIVSDDAAQLTGQALVLDGGETL